jgi:hypothetical protein
VINDSINLLNFGVFRGLVLSSILEKLCKLETLILPSKISEFDNLQKTKILCLKCEDGLSLILLFSTTVTFCHNFNVKLFSDNN